MKIINYNSNLTAKKSSLIRQNEKLKEYRELKSENLALDQKILELENDNQTIDDQIASKELIFAKNKKDISNKMDLLDSYQMQEQINNSQHLKLSQQCNRLSSDVAQRDLKTTSLLESFKAVNAENSSSHDANNRLKLNIVKLKNQLERMKLDIREQNNDKLKQQISD